MIHSSGSDAVIQFDPSNLNDTVTLKGVNLAILGAQDFVIHHA
jgi:hypothetical protein